MGDVKPNCNAQKEEKMENPGVVRKCNKCGKEKPFTAEFWPKNAHCKDGLEPTCKECRYKRSRGNYLNRTPGKVRRNYTPRNPKSEKRMRSSVPASAPL